MLSVYIRLKDTRVSSTLVSFSLSFGVSNPFAASLDQVPFDIASHLAISVAIDILVTLRLYHDLVTISPDGRFLLPQFKGALLTLSLHSR